MNSARGCVLAVVGLVLGTGAAGAQDVSRYRQYVLESTLESVVKSSGAPGTDAVTLHGRPAKIQELQWRAPYTSSSALASDPVRTITFKFVDDALFQIAVSYDRDRTSGLTNSEIVETLTAAYGAPMPRSGKAPVVRAAPTPDTVVVAQWETPKELLLLVRGTYDPEFQLVLTSKTLNARARQAIREAARLDAAEAPQRELDRRKKDAADEAAVRERMRATNKAAFRP